MQIDRPLKNTQGMTLIEGITAIALIAIFALILYSGFAASAVIMQRGDENRINEEAAGNLIEGETEYRFTSTSPKSKSLYFELSPGNKIRIEGYYVTIQNQQTQKELFTLFQTQPAP